MVKIYQNNLDCNLRNNKKIIYEFLYLLLLMKKKLHRSKYNIHLIQGKMLVFLMIYQLSKSSTNRRYCLSKVLTEGNL